MNQHNSPQQLMHTLHHVITRAAVYVHTDGLMEVSEMVNFMYVTV